MELGLPGETLLELGLALAPPVIGDLDGMVLGLGTGSMLRDAAAICSEVEGGRERGEPSAATVAEAGDWKGALLLLLSLCGSCCFTAVSDGGGGTIILRSFMAGTSIPWKSARWEGSRE